MSLRPDRFCNFVYTWSLARVEDRRQFDSDLLTPLPGRAQAAPSQAALEQEGAEFMSFMGAMTGETV